MPLITYRSFRFRETARLMIERTNELVADYTAQGYSLTLRQVYYQFVARDWFPAEWADATTGSTNNQRSYQKLGNIINDGRLAGLIDWESIDDITRELGGNSHWDSPADIIASAAHSFRLDKWEGQPYRCECFSPDTPIVTYDGMVDIGAIQVGDKVLTHEGNYRRVTKVIVNDYNGFMLRIKAAGLIPITVTPGHPFWSCRHDLSATDYKGAKRPYKALDWVSSDDLGKFDLLAIPRPEPTTIEPWPKPVTGPPSDAAYKAMGLYLAEGSVRPDGRTVQFALATREENYERVICDWAKTIGVSTHTAFGAGTRIVYLYSKPLADWLALQFGSGAYNKRLPRWAMRLPWNSATMLVEYYFRGDGCFCDESRASIDATTRSRQLAQQLQIKFLWSGIAASFDQVEDHGAPRYRVSVGGAAADRLSSEWGIAIPSKGIWRSKRYNHIRFSSDGRNALFPVRSVLHIPYCGKVINLEVECDHSYCVPASVHNCWVEKDALKNIAAKAARELDISYFSCRGYTSQTAIWEAGQRLKRYAAAGIKPVVIHLGDHDPSGIDMSRDIQERLEMFMRGQASKLIFHRIALNSDQVAQYNPPPNPAKSTDSRYAKYRAEHGDESWELDALDPAVIDTLIRDKVSEYRSDKMYAAREDEESEHRDGLTKAARRWSDVAAYLARPVETDDDGDELDDDALTNDDDEPGSHGSGDDGDE